MTRSTLVWLAAGLVAVGGCGGRAREYAEVEGVVRVNGVPTADIQVVFTPSSAAGTAGPRSYGSTDEQGRYRLAASNEDGGVVVGTHRVTFTDFAVGDGPEGGKSVGPRFPPRYATVKDTPYQAVEVRSGAQTVDFDLTR